MGSFVGLAHPAAVEVLASSGFQFVCIDTEHGAFDTADVEHAIRAGDARRIPVLVRVGTVGPEIGRALDAGAAGVIVPRVETAEQAAASVRAVRFPPVGERGLGAVRAAGYGCGMADYVEAAEESTACIVQVETTAGVANIEAIVAVPGIDLVFIGPGDLAVSTGHPVGSPAHTAVVRTIVDAARAENVPVGLFVADPADIANWLPLGVGLFLVGGDLAFLVAGAQAAASTAHGKITAVNVPGEGTNLQRREGASDVE